MCFLALEDRDLGLSNKFTITLVELLLSEYVSKAKRTDSKTEIGTESGLLAVINLAMWLFPSFEVFYT